MNEVEAGVRPKCPHFPRCGGCTALDRSYADQLAAKRRRLQELFHAWPRLEIPTIIPSPQICFYRHKVQLPFGHKGDGRKQRITLGCYGTESHDVIDQHECLIQDRDLSRIAWAIRSWANKEHLTAYDECQHTGFLRHALLRKGAGTGEVLVGLVTKGDAPPGTRRLAAGLIETASGALGKSDARIVGVVQNINTRRTNVVLGTREQVWWGRPFLKEKLGQFRFKLGLSTFFQVNPYQTPQLYEQVARWVPGGSRVIDIYCGVGSITLWLSSVASEVLGIEENQASVQAAREASHLNGIRNVRFVSGDAAQIVPSRIADGYTVAVVDPPRKGLEVAVANTLRKAGLQRLIYVSCNPETLVRDIDALSGELQLVSVQGVDMFPHTDHVECVAVLTSSNK